MSLLIIIFTQLYLYFIIIIILNKRSDAEKFFHFSSTKILKLETYLEIVIYMRRLFQRKSLYLKIY